MSMSPFSQWLRENWRATTNQAEPAQVVCAVAVEHTGTGQLLPCPIQHGRTRRFAQRAKAVLALGTLAASPALDGGDLETFYKQAKRIAPGPDTTIILSEPSGKLLLNTRLPFHGCAFRNSESAPANQSNIPTT
jgi:hypothetical protein